MGSAIAGNRTVQLVRGCQSQRRSPSPRPLACECQYDNQVVYVWILGAAQAPDADIRRIGARALLLDPHRFAARLAFVQKPSPVDVLKVALPASADEPDRRDIDADVILSPILFSSAVRLQISPRHQPAPPRTAAARIRHSFTRKPGGENADRDTGGIGILPRLLCDRGVRRLSGRFGTQRPLATSCVCSSVCRRGSSMRLNAPRFPSQ